MTTGALGGDTCVEDVCDDGEGDEDDNGEEEVSEAGHAPSTLRVVQDSLCYEEDDASIAAFMNVVCFSKL